MNRAMKWCGLAAVALTAGPIESSRAGFVLSASQITDFQQAVANYNGDGASFIYQNNNTYNQDPTQSTLDDPLNTASGEGRFGGGAYASTSTSGIVSVAPGTPADFNSLSFSLTAASSSSSGIFQDVDSYGNETYSGTFTPNATGIYQLSFMIDNSGQGASSNVTFGTQSGTLFSLDSSTAGQGMQTLTETLSLMAGTAYTVTGSALDDAHQANLFNNYGSMGEGSSLASFSLSQPGIVPEPASLAMVAAGLALVGLASRLRRGC